MMQVYFIKPIGMNGPIKIGCARYSAEDRLREIEYWTPFPLEILVAIPGSFGLEQRIQAAFWNTRSHAEWFHPSPRLLKAIADLIVGIPVEQAIDLPKRGRLARVVSDETRRRISQSVRRTLAERRAKSAGAAA